MDNWTLPDAEAHFEQVVENAQTNGPQLIGDDQEPRAVVLSFGEYTLLSKREPSLVEVLLSGPKLDDDDPFFEALERNRSDTGRNIEL